MILDVLIQASKTFTIKRDFATAKVGADPFQQSHPDTPGVGGTSSVAGQRKLREPPHQVCRLPDCTWIFYA